MKHIIKNPNPELRLGQKVCNWIQDQGYTREDVHIKLFHMSDEEFLNAINENVSYGIP